MVRVAVGRENDVVGSTDISDQRPTLEFDGILRGQSSGSGRRLCRGSRCRCTRLPHALPRQPIFKSKLFLAVAELDPNSAPNRVFLLLLSGRDDAARNYGVRFQNLPRKTSGGRRICRDKRGRFYVEFSLPDRALTAHVTTVKIVIKRMGAHAIKKYGLS